MQKEWEQRGCKADLYIRLLVERVGRCCHCTHTCVPFLESWVQGAQDREPPPPPFLLLSSHLDIPLSLRTQRWEIMPKFCQNITLSSTLSGGRYQSSPDRKLWWLEKRRKVKHTQNEVWPPGHKLFGTRQHILNFHRNEKKPPGTMGSIHKCLKNQWL